MTNIKNRVRPPCNIKQQSGNSRKVDLWRMRSLQVALGELRVV